MKTCPGCGLTLNRDMFWNHKSRYDGLQVYCKSCIKRIYWPKYVESHRAVYHRDKRKVLDRNLEWLRKNPDKKRAQNLRYQESHPGYASNKNANRKARVLSVTGLFTREDFEKIKETYGRACLRCGKPEVEVGLTPDHVIPLCHGGNNELENIQPLCNRCNKVKGLRSTDYRPFLNGQTLTRDMSEVLSLFIT